MQYSRSITSPEDKDILSICDQEVEFRNPSYFVKLLESDVSIAIRIRAVCILAEIGNEGSIPVL